MIVRGYASIDFGKPYKAIEDPRIDWNGWSVPHFTFKVFLEILKDIKHAILEQTSDIIIITGSDLSDEEKQNELYQTVVYKTDMGYSFDGWCWDFDKYMKPSKMVDKISQLVDLWSFIYEEHLNVGSAIKSYYYSIMTDLDILLLEAQRGELK